MNLSAAICSPCRHLEVRGRKHYASVRFSSVTSATQWHNEIPAMQKILFVDDQPQILQSLRLLFYDYDVITAENATDALLQLGVNPDVSVIVSDQRMPGMQGIDLLREVKRRHPDIIRILLTGYADIDAIISSVNDGEVFRFIPKPWDATKLREIVALAVRIFQRQRFAESALVERKQEPNNRLGILVVDDNPKHLSAMKSLLQQDYDVFAMDCFDKARAVILRHQVAIAICDAYVKGQNGVDFLMELKEAYPEVCAIMHSAQKDADIAIRLVNDVRVYRYLIKPFRKTEFLATVKAAQQQYLIWRQKPTLNDKSYKPEAFSFSEKMGGVAHSEADIALRILERGYSAFEQTFESLPIPAGILKVGGAFQKVNAALCNLLEYAREELLQLGLHHLVRHQNIDKHFAEVMHQLMRKKSPVSWEMIYTTKNGMVRLGKVTASLVQSEAGMFLYGFLYPNREKAE